MDYYKEYEEYAIEIDDACSCVNSNKCSNLNREIETMATAVDGINLSSVWQDGVASAFASAIDTTKKCLNDISSSISSLFMESEEIYIKLQQQLLFLKNANIKYMNTRDNEKPDYDDFSVSAEYENGVLVKEGYFRQSDYDKALDEWRKKIKLLEDECIALKIEIEKNKARLSEINSENVMSGGGFTTLEIKYNNTDNSIFKSDGSSVGNVHDIWNYLSSKVDENGNRILSDVAIAGILGNMQTENSTFDPNVYEGDTQKIQAAKGYGLIQWTNYHGMSGGRRDQLFAAADQIDSPVDSLQFQCEYLWDEIFTPRENAKYNHNGNPNYYAQLKASNFFTTNDPVEAAMIFHNVVEGSADSYERVINNRGSAAIFWYNELSDKQHEFQI